MWPHLGRLLADLERRHIQVGLITNGLKMNRFLTPQDLARLTWIRISLSGLDFGLEPDVPKVPDTCTLGFSYVVNSQTTPQVIDRVQTFSRRHNPRYLRLVPDCLSPVEQLPALTRAIEDLQVAVPQAFVQQKAARGLTPTVPCRISFLKPYVNSDGWLYRCSGVALQDRRFPTEYRMCRIQDIDTFFADVAPFECHFEKCFFTSQNRLLDQVCTPVQHAAFL